MKLLLIGHYCALMDGLTLTADKAGWEIYLLGGEPSNAPKPPRVFERYDYYYDSEEAVEVIDSVNPDVVLFMGEFDSTFDWRQPETAATKLLSGLMNLLMACGKHPRTHFVYLSSQEVFPSGDASIEELRQPAPPLPRGVAVAQGEMLCRSHARFTGLETTVVRLDHVYGVPKGPDETLSVICDMCLTALTQGRLTVQAGHRFSSIYLNDAVEGLFSILSARERKYDVYHLSSERVTDEREVARLIASVIPDIEITEPPAQNAPTCRALHCERARSEFHFGARHPIEKTLPLVLRGMQRALPQLLPPMRTMERTPFFKRNRGLKRALLVVRPFAESAICCALAFFLSRGADTIGYFERIDFYLLYVLLFSGLYGKRQAIVSAAASVAVTLLHADNLFDRMLDYNTYIWVAVLFTTGMLVGHLRDHLDTLNTEKDEEFEYLRQRLAETEEIQRKTVNIKREYEQRLVNYNGSLGRLHQITAELSGMEPGDVLFCAASATAQAMESKDVSVYQVANDRYCRLFSSTSQKSRALGKTIAYSELPELYAAIRERRVFINKQLDQSLPMMALGVYDGEQLTVILMIWEMKIEKITLYQANLLMILGYLIMLSLNRANQYIRTLTDQRYLAGTRIMESSAFHEIVRLYENAAERSLVCYTLLHLGEEPPDAQTWNARIAKLFRQSDHLGENEQGEILALLPNATPADAQVVIDRLRGAGIACEIRATGGDAS